MNGELHFDVIVRMVRTQGQEKRVRAMAEPDDAPAVMAEPGAVTTDQDGAFTVTTDQDSPLTVTCQDGALAVTMDQDGALAVMTDQDGAHNVTAAQDGAPAVTAEDGGMPAVTAESGSVPTTLLVPAEQDDSPSVTAAPVLECPYQYPDLQQFNAVLSNMMNELTGVFVRANQMVRAGEGRRAQPSRFKVVSEKTSQFFEGNFANMTKEFGQFFNSTWLQVSRARDPCENQEELKRLWRELLESALVGLGKAAAQCIDQCLKDQPQSNNYSTRNKLRDFLAKELARIKVGQLNMLCDRFQLCYSDLL